MSSKPISLAPVSCEQCCLGCSREFPLATICPLVTRELGPGEQLSERGAPANTVWFVKQGAVSAGDPQARAPSELFPPGSIVGLEALEQATYSETTWVAEAATVCSMPAEALKEWLETRPTLATELRATAQGRGLARALSEALSEDDSS